MQEPTEMDVLPLPSVTAAEAARSATERARAARAGGPGFGAALDAAMKPAARRPAGGPGDSTPAERARAAREDDDRAAEQAALWMTAARAARSADQRRLRSREQGIAAADAAESRRNAADASRSAEPSRPAATTRDAGPARSTEDRATSTQRAHGPDAAAARTAARNAQPTEPTAAEDATAAAAKATPGASAPPASAVDGANAAPASAVDGANTTLASVGEGVDVTPASAGEAVSGPRGDVHDAERSIETLDPEFRARLERVIERMESELGHEVTVVETHRDGDRQNYLYEQGRTRPGPVVTWTRNSNHTRGLAADLVVDGSYDNPAGYARLERIAAEEGLHTLGARDPGHVELPRGTPAPPRTQATSAASVTAASFGVAQVATVATVAAPGQPVRTAQVAQVAQVAEVAQPGSYATVAIEQSAQAVTTTGGASADALAAVREAVRGFAASAMKALGGEDARNGEDGGRMASADGAATSLFTGTTDRAPFTFDASGTGRTQPAGGAAQVLRAEVAGRTERVIALQDAAAAQPLSQVTLRLEGEDGVATRVQVGLRGSVVGASIDTADPVAAASLRAHVAELRQALEGQGLDPSSLLVRAAAKPTEATDPSRVLATPGKADPMLGPLATNVARDSSAQRDSSGNGQSNHQAARRDADAQRQRQSRNDKEKRP